MPWLPVRFAVIGGATGKTLWEYGYWADLCPQVYTSAALGQALLQTAAPKEPLYLFRSAQATGELPDALRSAGRTVEDRRIYDVIAQAGRRPLSGGLSGLCQRRRRPGLLGGLRGAPMRQYAAYVSGTSPQSSESPVLSFLPHCSGDFSRGHHPGDPGGPSIIISAPVHDLILPDS